MPTRNAEFENLNSGNTAEPKGPASEPASISTFLTPVLKLLGSAWPIGALLLVVGLTWYLLPRAGIVPDSSALFGVTFTASLLVVVSLVVYQVRFEALEALESLRLLFVLCIAALLVSITLPAAFTLIPEDADTALLRLLHRLLSPNVMRQFLLAIAYAALVLAIHFWGLMFAANVQVRRLEQTTSTVNLGQVKDSLRDLLEPIRAQGIPVTNIVSLRKSKGGTFELTLHVKEHCQVQDFKGEWITSERGKNYTVKVDSRCRVMSLEEQTNKS